MNEVESTQEKIIECYVLKCREANRFVVYKPPFSIQVIFDSCTVSEYSLGYAHGKLLELFTKNPDEVIDRERIISVAWPDRVVSSNSINQAISIIRQLIGDESAHKAIKTIPRRGYIFDSTYILEKTLSNTSVVQTNSDKNFGEENSGADHPPLQLKKSLTESNTSTLNSRQGLYKNVSMAILIIILSSGLFVRWYYIFISDWSYSSSTIDFGRQKVTYIASTIQEIDSLKKSLEPIRKRLMNVADGPSYVLFNKMHDFYNIVCLGTQSDPKFITVNLKKLNVITDEHLMECLK